MGQQLKVSKNATALAEDMGLPASKALEWQVRRQLTDKIAHIIKSEDRTISEVAKKAGTSRARVTDIVKGNSEGISIDVLLRVLGALGSSVKISFQKAS